MILNAIYVIEKLESCHRNYMIIGDCYCIIVGIVFIGVIVILDTKSVIVVIVGLFSDVAVVISYVQYLVP